jgi:hypothetical protein
MLDGELVGRALVRVPAGTYTHQIFCYEPERSSMCGRQKLSHPIFMPSGGIIEAYPIRRGDRIATTWES